MDDRVFCQELSLPFRESNWFQLFFHPYKLIKDVRTGYETSNIQAVMDGDLKDFIKAYLMEYGNSWLVVSR